MSPRNSVRLLALPLSPTLQLSIFAEKTGGEGQAANHGTETGGGGVRQKKATRPSFELEINEDGEPILPPLDGLHLDSRKDLVRVFLTAHYSNCQSPKIKAVSTN
jgi:hypothetical protein